METLIEQNTATVPSIPREMSLVPEIGDPLRALEHYHRYLYASRFVKDRRALDVACGEGYGTAFLSLNAQSVLGIDADDALVTQARQKYSEFTRARFQSGRCEEPLTSPRSVDVVVSFSTLEYIAVEPRRRFMDNIKTALRPGGILVIGTPVREGGGNGFPSFSPVEFSEFLKEHFRHSLYVGQKPVTVSGIWSLYQWGDDFFRFHARDGLFTPPLEDEMFADPDYIIAICSDNVLPRAIADSSKSFYFDSSQMKRTEESISRTGELEEQVRTLEALLGGLRGEVSERNISMEKLREEFEETLRQKTSLDADSAEKENAIMLLKNDLKSAHASLEMLQQAYDLRSARANTLKDEQTSLSNRFQELHRNLEERSQTAHRLGQENDNLRIEVGDFKRKSSAQESEIAAVKEEIDRSRQSIGKLQEQLDERAETARLRAEEITALRAQVISLQTLLDERDVHRSASAEELAAYKEEIRLLHEEIKGHQKMASLSDREAEDLRAKISELEQVYSAHAATAVERDQLRATVRELEKNLDEQRNQILAQKRERGDLGEKLAATERMAAEKSDAAMLIKNELDELRALSGDAGKEAADHIHRIAELEKQIKEQSEFLVNIQRELDEQAMAARGYKGELEKQTIAFDTYQKSQSDLQQRYSRSQIRVQELQSTMTMVEQRIERINSSPVYRFLSSLGIITKAKV